MYMFNYMYGCVYMRVSARCPQRPEQGFRSSGAGFTGVCKTTDMVARN